MFVAPFVLAVALTAADKGGRIEPAIPLAGLAKLAHRQQAVELPVIIGGGGDVVVMPFPGGGGMMPGGPGVGLPGLGGGRALSGALAAGGPPDETVLRNAKLETSTDALLDFFRKRTPPIPARTKINELITRLSAKDAGDRDSAQGHLIALGQPAVPALREVANNTDDIEGSTRAKACLQNIEGNGASPIVIQAARLLGDRKPVAAAEVLIGYLPYAEDEMTYEEIEAALIAVAVRNGKPDPALIKALRDPLSLRRGAAAQALCQAGGPLSFAAVRPLLRDKSPAVRLRAGLGLVNAYDAEAIPVLIDLLADLPPRLCVQAEEYLGTLAGEWAVSGPKGHDYMSRQLRREVWSSWWKSTEGDKLLNEFKTRTPSDEDRPKIEALITKLGDAKAEERDAAANDLANFGTKATGLLRRSIMQNHARISPFAAKVLETIEKDTPNPMPGAAPRLLALRKPPGTLKTLVDYAPAYEAEDILNQLVDVAAAVGCSNGKGDEVLLKALESDVPERRTLSIMALTKGRATEHLPELKKTLNDKNVTVRLRAAQGLAGMGQKVAVPALIGLLKDLPIDQTWEAEEFLTRLADDKSPSVAVTNDAARAKAQELWTKWWEENESKVSMARLDGLSRELGFYIVVENWNQMRAKGRVMEVDARGKIRWEIGDLNWPGDAQILRNGNVLLVEQNQWVRERDRSGKIVGMDRTFNSPFHAERLPNGNTFIAGRNNLQIIDTKGTAVVSHNQFNHTILGARHFRDGTMAYVTYSGTYHKLDKTGKEVKNINYGPWWNFNFNGAEILPGDRVVVSISNTNRVAEYDDKGKQVWECSITQPSIPTRLSNGNILVGGSTNCQTIYEIDRRGKIVREMKDNAFRTWRVTRR